MKTEPLPNLTPKERNSLIDKYKTILETPVTFIFVTRNRCPHKDPKKNPLVWAIQTLENNIGKKIDEYVFVDDNSDDYTKSSIKWCIEKYGLNAKIINNSERKGCSWSRQIGLKESSNRIIYFGDDDCLFKPDFLLGSLISFKKLEKSLKGKLALMNLCVFDRALDYIDTVEKNQIGKTDFKNTWFYHNFDCRPIPHDKLDILYKPIEIGTFKGVSINNRDYVLESGGFSDLSMWNNDYSEHIELSKKLQEMEFLMYHLPDSRISAFHLKYGAKSSDVFDEDCSSIKFDGVDYTLGELINFSTEERVNTGARVSSEDFHIAEIGSFFSFYLKFGKDLAIKSATKEYNNFVLKNKVFSTTPQKIDPIDKRRDIWIKAIRKGILATKIQIGEDYAPFGEDLISTLAKCQVLKKENRFFEFFR